MERKRGAADLLGRRWWSFVFFLAWKTLIFQTFSSLGLDVVRLKGLLLVILALIIINNLQHFQQFVTIQWDALDVEGNDLSKVQVTSGIKPKASTPDGLKRRYWESRRVQTISSQQRMLGHCHIKWKSLEHWQRQTGTVRNSALSGKPLYLGFRLYE